MATRYTSPITRRYRITSTVFFLISCILVLAPLVTFIFTASTTEFAWYTWLLIACGVILWVVDLIRHAKVRATFLCILLGISLSVDPTKMIVLIAMTATCVLLDEYISWPIHVSARRKARINNQIDRRER